LTISFSMATNVWYVGFQSGDMMSRSRLSVKPSMRLSFQIEMLLVVIQ